MAGTASWTSRDGWKAVAEFLVVGGGTLVLLPFAWLLRYSLGLDEAELIASAVGFYAAHVINDPHFAVTYLLFYRDAPRHMLDRAVPFAQRVRYALAGFAIPALLGSWALGAAVSGAANTLGWLFQLMFFLVGWHYTKQGFGVLVVLSGRRGFFFDVTERRTLLGHALAGWAYAWTSPAEPGRELVESGVVYRTLAQPVLLEWVFGACFALSTLALLVVLVRAERQGRRPPWVPLAGFLITIWLWTVFSRFDPLLAYVIPTLHSLQYWYFVGMLRGNQARSEVGPPHFRAPPWQRLTLLFSTALGLGWVSLRGLPAWLDQNWVLADVTDPYAFVAIGPTPYLAAFATFVNLHHYVMDAVIWRRDHPESQFLAQ